MSDEPRDPAEETGAGKPEIFVPPEEAGEMELDASRGEREGWDEPREGGGAWKVPVIVGALLLLLVGGWVWMRSNGGPPKLPPPPEAGPAPAPPAEAAVPMPEAGPAAEPVPPLGESDAFVRESLQRILENPRLAAWLAPEGLVTRFVAAIDDVARGKSPRSHLVSLDPGRGFRVDELPDGTQRISDQSFRRYDPVVDAFVALDTPSAVRLYRRLEPLFAEAYRDLGYPQADFRATLETAIDRLLEVEIPDEAPAVKPRITSWAFADPRLESLDPAAKHLLRLGPRNARKVQTKLRTLETALTLAPPAPGT